MPVLGFADELKVTWMSMKSHIVHSSANSGIDNNVPIKDYHKSAQRREDIMRNRYYKAGHFNDLVADFDTLIRLFQISPTEKHHFIPGGDLLRFFQGFLQQSPAAKVELVFERGGTRPPGASMIIDGRNKWLPVGAPLKRIEIHDPKTGRWHAIWNR